MNKERFEQLIKSLEIITNLQETRRHGKFNTKNKINEVMDFLLLELENHFKEEEVE